MHPALAVHAVYSERAPLDDIKISNFCTKSPNSDQDPKIPKLYIKSSKFPHSGLHEILCVSCSVCAGGGRGEEAKVGRKKAERVTYLRYA